MQKKTAKPRMHLSLRAEILFYAIVEPFILAVGLFGLFIRFQYAYEHTQAPVMDNLPASLGADMIIHWVEWLTFGSLVALWIIGKVYRIVQDRRERRWEKEDQDKTDEKLDKMVTALNNIEKLLGKNNGSKK